MYARILWCASALFASVGAWAQAGSHAEVAVEQGVAASGHASASAGHALAASGQVTFAASAVPLSVAGASLGVVGGASTQVADDLLQAASAPIGTPLPVADVTFTTIRPDQALQAPAAPR